MSQPKGGAVCLSRRGALLGVAALPTRIRAVRPRALPAAASRLRFLVGGAGGSSTDSEGRAFAAFFERHLPQADVQIVNLPGPSGLEAYRALADSPSDGLTVAWATTPRLPARCIDQAAPELMGRLSLLGAVQREPLALIAPPGGATDVESFRRVAASGDALGTAQAGSPSHLAALRLQDIIGTRLNLVMFPSPAAARQAAVAGDISAALLALGETVAALREGRVEGIGISADEPAAAFPQLRPLREAGLELTTYIMRGIAAPVGVAPEQTAILVDALQAVAADPEFTAQANAQGFVSTWLAGSGWTNLTEAERKDLAALWQRAPWRDGTLRP